MTNHDKDSFDLAAKLDKFRFGVEREGSGFSNIWFVDQKSNDLYISARAARGSTKITLHGSRECHVKGKLPIGEKVLSRWRRAETPANGAVRVLVVDFPTELTYQWKPLERIKPKHQVVTISAAPVGYAAEFSFFYSLCTPEIMEDEFRTFGFPIAHINMPSGEFVYIVWRQIPFDRSRIPDGPKQVSGVPISIPQGGQLENLSMIAWTDPKDDEPVFFTNLQGVRLRRT